MYIHSQCFLYINVHILLRTKNYSKLIFTFPQLNKAFRKKDKLLLSLTSNWSTRDNKLKCVEISNAQHTINEHATIHHKNAGFLVYIHLYLYLCIQENDTFIDSQNNKHKRLDVLIFCLEKKLKQVEWITFISTIIFVKHCK